MENDGFEPNDVDPRHQAQMARQAIVTAFEVQEHVSQQDLNRLADILDSLNRMINP